MGTRYSRSGVDRGLGGGLGRYLLEPLADLLVRFRWGLDVV